MSNLPARGGQIIFMNYFDIVAGILLILAAIKGFRNGFIIELASLAALILGIIISIRFSELTAGLLSRFIDSQYLGLIAFCITFVVVVVLVHLLARLIDRLVKAIALGWFNRLLGVFLAALKAALVMSVILLALEVFGLESSVVPPKVQAKSLLYRPVKNAAVQVLELFKTDLNHLLYPGKKPDSPVVVQHHREINRR